MPLGPNAPAGNAAATAPAGQRPSAGTVASWEQEITPAGTGLGWPNPLPPKPRNVPGMVSPRSARTRTTPWTPEIARSCAVSGSAGAAGPGPDTAWPPGDSYAIWSFSTFDFATVPHRVKFLASCVLIATTATVVMNSARTRPLTARKEALGSSARRRAAISVPGWLVHRAMALAAAMV